jgi:hypothetical protein
VNDQAGVFSVLALLWRRGDPGLRGYKMQITADAISLVRIQSFKNYKQTPIVKTSVSRQWHVLAFRSEEVDSCLPSL